MVFWMILIVSILIIIGCIVIYNITYEECAVIVGIPVTIVAILMLVMVIVEPLEVKKEMNLFLRQKEYIESHISENEYEDAALTTKKIELNEWLIEAQYKYTNYKLWTFYDESIMDLELIQ